MQDRFNLTGKVVVVTGGTGLLGSAYCQALADHGAQVVMADLAAADPIGKAKLVQTPTGEVAYGVNCDVGQEAEVVHLFADVMAKFGRVDAVLNNAAATGEPAGGPVDLDREAAGIAPSQVAAVVADNYAACRQWREQVIGWQDFYEKQRQIE
jgi:NAD(P)-dependent dehydrogenase (short-subunit alcohol dehydrogenase family)